jgi:RecB family exonuclease
VTEPVSGFDARERGQFLHRALETLWTRLGDSRALRSCDAAARSGLVRTAIDAALAEVLRRRATPLAAPLITNERLRAIALLDALLAQEAQRADFTVMSLEGEQQHVLGGVPIRVRMDRLDRLEDGRLIVLDYKSGAPQAFDALAVRPLQPQLLAYAMLAPGELAGLAAVHLRPEAIRWRGAAAAADLLPGLSARGAPVAPWSELLALWRLVIDALAREFATGDSAVQPHERACEQCHLAALCRIDRASYEARDIDHDAGEEPGDEADP